MRQVELEPVVVAQRRLTVIVDREPQRSGRLLHIPAEDVAEHAPRHDEALAWFIDAEARGAGAFVGRKQRFEAVKTSSRGVDGGTPHVDGVVNEDKRVRNDLPHHYSVK